MRAFPKRRYFRWFVGNMSASKKGTILCKSNANRASYRRQKRRNFRWFLGNTNAVVLFVLQVSIFRKARKWRRFCKVRIALAENTKNKDLLQCDSVLSQRAKAKQLYLLRKLYLQCKLYFDFVKVIFRLSAEVKVIIHNLPKGQISLQRNITVEDNITPSGISLPTAMTVAQRCTDT